MPIGDAPPRGWTSFTSTGTSTTTSTAGTLPAEQLVSDSQVDQIDLKSDSIIGSVDAFIHGKGLKVGACLADHV